MHSMLTGNGQCPNKAGAEAAPRSTKSPTVARSALGLATLFALLPGGARTTLAQTESVLYAFTGTPDAAEPCCGMPALDKAGNIYGTTLYGGTYNLGAAWKVTPSGTESVLWSFGNGTDGTMPVGFTLDKQGNLYGTTVQGGTYNQGTVFRVTPSGTETVLWNFGSGTDGTQPGSGVTRDKQGNLYGTTQAGGAYDGGTVFELTPSGTETVLWSFGNGSDGAAPDGPILNVTGTLYGTTRLGGSPPHYGTVWELTPAGTETVLHSFTGDEGSQPDGNVVMDRKGNLYGNCHDGGPNQDGTVFRLSPSGKLKIVHAFDGTDGINPYATVVMDRKQNLYSTTHEGGTYNGGTVWKMTRSGELTVLWNLGNGSDGNETTSGVALDRQGNIYGMTQFGGGTSCHLNARSGCGTVFKVMP